ncbi:MAG TPA: hypothetical protein VGD69_23935 [Herpetosiphonaceae bacterium]
MFQSLRTYGTGLLILGVLAACGQAPAETSGTTADPSQAPVTIGGETTSSGPTMGGPIVSHGGALTGHVGLVDNLRAKGLMVEPTSEVEQPFLGAKGTTLRISGGEINQPADIQSFEYPSADAAQADLSHIGADGNPTTSIVEWTGAPHFFHKEQLIVLYVGDDPAVVSLLNELLGPQVAGR